MLKNHRLVLIALVVFIIAAAGLYAFQKKPQDQIPIQTTQTTSDSLEGNDEAFKNALNLYSKKKSEGLDMSNGPCLGIIADDWVLDIAHNPRQSVDDREENQCEEFKAGTAHHFIELDTEGKLIRAL